jgi:diguanylate cyclase (GGDEF)-like protein
VARAAVIESMSEPVFVMDSSGRLIDLNAAAEHLVAVPLAASLGRTLSDVAPWCAPAIQGTGPRELVWADDEGTRTFEVTETVLGSREGLAKGRLLVLRDVSARAEVERELRAARAALEEANARLARLASTDDLTGLTNRRVFMDRLGEEGARARRTGAWLALVVADLDHFKTINDTHGHAVGDEVLMAVADAIRSVARETDVAARIGGEELAVLLPETGEAGAAIFAERLRRAVADTATAGPLAERGIRVTTSVGVAAAQGRDLEESVLLKLADERLYRAKRDGRNRVCTG